MFQFKSPESAVRFIRALGCLASAYIVGATVVILILLMRTHGC